MRRENSPAVRVLIVDDELLIRWSLVQTLIASGATVVEAGDARTALREMRTGRPFDVAVLDLRLPDCSDLGLLGAMRLLSPATRIILMTAFGTPDLRAQARALGVSHVLDKPFDLDMMAGLVFDAGAAG